MEISVPLITTTTLGSFAGALRSQGVPLDGLLQRRRLPTVWSVPTGDWVPYVQMREFLADVVAREDLPTLGQVASARNGSRGLDTQLRAALFGAPTLMHALQVATQVACRQSTHLELWIEAADGFVRLCHAHAVGPSVPGYTVVEDHTTGLTLGLVRHYLGDDWTPARLVYRRRVAHRGQPVAPVPFDTLDVPKLLHEAYGGFDIPAELVWTPNPRQTRDAPVSEDKRRSRGSTATTLRSLLRSYVVDCRPRIELVSELLGLSVRALQRELAREETTFSQVLALAELDVAEIYLADERVKLSEIALMLGYSEQSAFTRAFRRWTGTTPRAYREKLLAGEHAPALAARCR